jgi:lipoic acid synthetase
MIHPLPVLPSSAVPETRKPAWLKVRAPGGPNYLRLRRLMRDLALHSVCEEAHCPNIGECWEEATATFMILGDVCTRNCGYCAVAHGTPVWEDREEPERIGRAVAELGLEHVVITSVNRDDLADGGAAHWAATVRAVHAQAPACRVEVLVPDFLGRRASLDTVVAAAPAIFNHNTETVPRLYKVARHGGRYERVLELFRHVRATAPGLPLKSGVILGLGEERDELVATMRDLVTVGVSILTLGQYLRPSREHLPVARYYHPDEFAELAVIGREIGFAHVESGPLVRSSYHARRQADDLARVRGGRRRGRGAALHPLARRAATADAGEGRAVRVRQGPDRGVGGPLRHQVLDRRDPLHPDRHRAAVHLAVGDALPPARLVRLCGDAGVPRHPHAGVPLHLAQRGTGMGVGSFFTSKLDEAIGWARKYSIFQYPFVTACCGMEYMATACSHYDVDRFGAGLPRFSPRQADVLFVVGTISHKMAPVLKRIYDQMTEPKWVVAFGVCTCTGGFYDNYATVQGIDTIIPVDVYIPGCPPRPESVLDGLMKLQDKIAAQTQRF